MDTRTRSRRRNTKSCIKGRKTDKRRRRNECALQRVKRNVKSVKNKREENDDTGQRRWKKDDDEEEKEEKNEKD